MATGVLGLGSGQASALNSDLIDKLKTAERKSTVEPYETSLEDMTLEKEIFATIDAKVSELLSAIKPFDLFVTGGATVFDQKTATTSGDSAVFDAADVSALNKGVTTVDITSLAQKDVYQSKTISDIVTPLTGIGDLTIGSETFITEGKTYQEIADEINSKTGMNASLEQVGTDSYRLVLKSEESGLDNALIIGGTASANLGFDLVANHTLTAKNLEAKVDGVLYSVSTNNLSVDGLKISAVKEGISTINIVEDNTGITTSMENFITKYNELVTMIDDATSADSSISDKSALRDIVTQVKNKIFGSYGSSNDKSLFNFGLELDKGGTLSLDATIFNKAIEDDLDGLKDLFIGTAEKEGLGTQLKAVFDEMSYTDGILTIFENAMTKRESTLNTDKDKAQESLDSKYKQLSLQFASYGAIINQMESSFSGLQLMIAQSSSGN